jgi:hypothetical protein
LLLAYMKIGGASERQVSYIYLVMANMPAFDK